MRTLHIDKYYTAEQHLLDTYNRTRKEYGFNAESLSGLSVWKEALRTRLREITGMNRMEKCELQPELLESERLDGYRRDRMLIQTEPDIWMPFYVLVPEKASEGGRLPVMINPHGHSTGGKYSPAGRHDIPAIKDKINEYNNDYGVEFVKRGYIAFCPDARGFGERREWMKQGDGEDDFVTSTCVPLNHLAISLGQSLTGMWAWDLTRLLDYIETRDDCDSQRIGCGGLSGGGMQTLWLAALDERVKCAIISGYFYGYRDSLLKLSGNCGCNYVPHLWNTADMGDIGALIAPRALLVETGSNDPLNGERGVANVTEQLDITRKAYALYNAEEKLYHHIFEGRHLWNGERTYSFVEKWL